EQGLDLLLQLGHGRIHFAGERFDETQLVRGSAVGFEAGNGFNTPHAGGNRVFADDAEQTDLAGRAGVRAAAKLHRVTVQLPCPAPDLNDPDGVAVFVAEELQDVLARLHVGVGNFG